MRRITYILALGLFAMGALPSAQESAQSSESVAAFVTSINDYVAMHRRLEKMTGPITLDSSVDSINRSIQALAAAIRVERPYATQGALFTPALAHALRARVSDALLDHGLTFADIIASEPAAGARGFVPKVNATFPWILAAPMVPCVVEALPRLPSELQYRIVGNDLVLIDVHASLIVDVLPNLMFDDDDPVWRPDKGTR